MLKGEGDIGGGRGVAEVNMREEYPLWCVSGETTIGQLDHLVMAASSSVSGLFITPT